MIFQILFDDLNTFLIIPLNRRYYLNLIRLDKASIPGMKILKLRKTSPFHILKASLRKIT